MSRCPSRWAVARRRARTANVASAARLMLDPCSKSSGTARGSGDAQASRCTVSGENAGTHTARYSAPSGVE